MSTRPGEKLPRLRTAVPGPRSRALAQRLARVEGPDVTYLADDFPIFLAAGRGANLTDVDGNRYLDLTSAFGVAGLGHAGPRLVRAMRAQLNRLPHGMGDVHPTATKVELLERLAELAPRGMRGEHGARPRAILSSTGAEAVESALKTAAVATGRPGVIAFTGAYHGLTYGALAATWRPHFRRPFARQLGRFVVHLPFPDAYRPPPGVRLDDPAAVAADVLRQVEETLEAAEVEGGDAAIGAVLVEPIQGRGGVRVPPDDFLPGLRRLCDEQKVLLIFDEVYTGFGRTGRLFAGEHWGVAPDLLVVGKTLGGGFPISACLGRPEVMERWAKSDGEAVHTSTFLGHPVGCAAALAVLEELEARDLVAQAADRGRKLEEGLKKLAERHAAIGQVRGKGLMLGVELVRDRQSRAPDAQLAGRVVKLCLRRGVVVLSGGDLRNVLSLSPPFVITERQIEFALEILDAVLGEAAEDSPPRHKGTKREKA